MKKNPTNSKGQMVCGYMKPPAKPGEKKVMCIRPVKQPGHCSSHKDKK